MEGRLKKTDDRKTDKKRTGEVGEVRRQLSKKRGRQRKDQRRTTGRQDRLQIYENMFRKKERREEGKKDFIRKIKKGGKKESKKGKKTEESEKKRKR